MTSTIFVPVAMRDTANQAAHQLGIDPEGWLSTLSVPLVPADGPHDAAPSHYGCRGVIPEDARLWLESHQDLFPGAMWWRWGDNKRLLASHDPSSLGQFWDWDNCLASAGLQRQLLPLP